MTHYSDRLRRYNHLVTELDSAYHEAAMRIGLSDCALQILYAVAEHGTSCPLSSIVLTSGISKQTINSALRKLEADGIVRLEAADGRKKTVCLTKQGQTLVQQTVLKIVAIEDSIISSYPPSDWDIYLAMTEQYLRDFKDRIREL